MFYYYYYYYLFTNITITQQTFIPLVYSELR